MEKPKCPYMVSGLCSIRRCIYLPDQQCMKESEFKRRLQFAKEYSKKKKIRLKMSKKEKRL